MQKPILTLLVILLSFLGSSAQNFDLNKDRIEVEVSSNNEIIYIHTIQKGQTIYSLSRYFKIPVQDLMFINDIKEDQIISLDSEIKIPLDPSQLNTPLDKTNAKWLPVVYKVKKGETLYSISNSYFPQRMDHLIHRNNIQSFFIKDDQELLVGWWGQKSDEALITQSEILSSDHQEEEEADPIEKQDITPEIIIEEPEDEPSVEKITENEKKVIDIISQIMEEKRLEEERSVLTQVDESNGETTLKKQNESDENPPSNLKLDREDLNIAKTEINKSEAELAELNELKKIEKSVKTFSKKGIGLWDKNDPDATNLFVMHRTAKINSLVKLYNPVTKKTVTARVIGHIIDKLYPPDIDIIVTKGVAQKLGARDSRFRIEMNYYE